MYYLKQMKKTLLILLSLNTTTASFSQASKIELYELVKSFLPDSTGYENVGDWAVSKPKKYGVKWKEDRLIMSNDTSINFYRMGTADIAIKGKTFRKDDQPLTWNVMLKGPRMGYASFSIISSPTVELQPKCTVDSLFGKKLYTAKLLKSCDNKTLAGYYYYEVKLPKKDPAFVKFSWLSVNGNTAIRIDCYDSWSRYAVKLDCPK